MANFQLNAAILTGGIQNTNFFNGRVLAAEDLTDFQLANAQQHQQLGRAIGEGVGWGLKVTLGSNTDPSQPVLHVTSGLAINRRGEAVALATDVDVQLVETLDIQNISAGGFAECQPPQGTIPANLGCYVLTASPVSGLQGWAPMTGGSNGVASACASRYVVEGVQFDLLPLRIADTSDPTTLRGEAAQLYSTLCPLFRNLAGLNGTAPADLEAKIAPALSKFRNVMAHLCFGTDKLQGFAANPFGRTNGDSSFAQYGILDDLRNQTPPILTDCAVPLALVYWTAAGVQFVDMWSVRRTVFPGAASEAWASLSGARRLTEGLAMLLQFQEQIGNMMQSDAGLTPLTAVRGIDYFRYLPAAVPLPTDDRGMRGFNVQQFLNGLTYLAPVFVEGAKLLSILSRSFSYAPMNLTSAELVWTYLVRQNIQAIDNAVGTRPQQYVILASGHMPFEGQARFDVNHWNYANFS